VRASRLLSILLMLHTRGQVSAQAIADELEISVRTVYRDVEALGAAGIPVYATRGRRGGFRLVEGYRTKLTGLTEDEAAGLFLAGLPSAAADLGLGEVVAATQLKLLAALPPQLRARAERIRDRFLLDAPGWERAADSPPHLEAVAAAVWSQQRLRVRYQRANRDVVDRVLEPLGLVLKAGVWYLVAAPTGRSPRTYRLSRVQTVEPLDETFEPPAGFVLHQHWADYQRDYEQRLFRATATVRLSVTGRQLLFLIGSIAARAGYEAMSAPDEDGWTRTTIPIESVPHAQHALMQLGAEVEVLDPPELREAIAGSAAAMLARYADGSGGRGAGTAGGAVSGSTSVAASPGGAGCDAD
jgi:predicted DNA-binding transcriptional regulator YafY